MDSISMFRYLEPVRMGVVLPRDGPSASIVKPAYRMALDEEGRSSLSFGMGEANRFVNSLNVRKSYSYTFDLGAI